MRTEGDVPSDGLPDRGAEAGASGRRGAAEGPRDASHWGLAQRLRDEFPLIFRTRVAAKRMVDEVFRQMGEVLEEDGYLCLRGIGTIRTLEASPRGSDGRVVRRRLSIATSWAMLDRLNPENPKRKRRNG